MSHSNPEVVRRRASPLAIGWTFALLLQLLLPESLAAPFLPARSLLLFLLAVASLSFASPQKFWSAPTVFLVVVGVFHLGLTPFWITGAVPEFTRAADYVWFYGELGERALQLINVGLAAYTTAALYALSIIPPGSSTPLDSSDRESRAVTTLANAGWFLAAAGIVSWYLFSVTAGGFSVLTASYSQYLAATSSTPVHYTYYVIGLGLTLSALRPKSGYFQNAVFALFALWASNAFVLGLRGEVLFSAAAAAVVLATRRRLPSAWTSLILSTALLYLVALVKAIRQQGLNSEAVLGASASPMAGLGELGSTIRVVAHVVSWHDVQGDPYAGGATYTAFPMRMLERALGLSSTPHGAPDFRMFNVEIAHRSGGIGGSVVAEAYHNFGPVGIVLVMAGIGGLFAYFSTRTVNLTALLAYIVLAVPLFNHVRNSFVPVIPMTIMGIIYCWVVLKLTPKASGDRGDKRTSPGKLKLHD